MQPEMLSAAVLLLAAMENVTREELLMKLGAARARARVAWRLIDIEVAPKAAAFQCRAGMCTAFSSWARVPGATAARSAAPCLTPARRPRTLAALS
jgi:hypothetical protein